MSSPSSPLFTSPILYIEHLPSDIKENKIRELFSTYGSVQSIQFHSPSSSRPSSSSTPSSSSNSFIAPSSSMSNSNNLPTTINVIIHMNSLENAQKAYDQLTKSPFYLSYLSASASATSDDPPSANDPRINPGSSSPLSLFPSISYYRPPSSSSPCASPSGEKNPKRTKTEKSGHKDIGKNVSNDNAKDSMKRPFSPNTPHDAYPSEEERERIERRDQCSDANMEDSSSEMINTDLSNPSNASNGMIDHTESSANHAKEEADSSNAMRTSQSNVSSNSSTPFHATTLHRILLITIQNPQHLLTTDILYSFFGKYGGVVQKIVLFVKNIGLQALVQMSTCEEATMIKKRLDGRYLYPNEGSCALLINYSNLKELNVKENSLKSKDYTNPNLPVPSVDRPIDIIQGMYRYPLSNSSSASNDASGAAPSDHSNPNGAYGYPTSAYFGGYNANPGYPSESSHSPAQSNDMSMGSFPGASMHPNSAAHSSANISAVLLVSNLNEQVTCDELFNLFSCYGNIVCIKKLRRKGYALVEYVTHENAKLALTHLRSYVLFGKSLEVRLSIHKFIQSNKAVKRITMSDYRQKKQKYDVSSESTEGYSSTHDQRRSQTPTSMYRDEKEAKEKVYPSEKEPENLPEGGNDMEEDTDSDNIHEYALSWNRFSGKYMNYKKYIYSPTRVLHVSNLFAGVTEDILFDHLLHYGQLQPDQIRRIKFKERMNSTNTNEKCQAFVEFNAIETATNTLATCHNTELEGFLIKIAFSMNNLNPRKYYEGTATGASEETSNLTNDHRSMRQSELKNLTN